jgi:protein gp37
MGINSKIEWTENTFNPWIGCAKISPACDHCYAADLSARTFKVKWGAGEQRKRTSEAYWKKPLKWSYEAAKAGVRPRIFCASLADVFDSEVQVQWRDDLADLIERTPNLDWMLLTKRIGNAAKMLSKMFFNGTPSNIHLGITICNQVEADRDISKLLSAPVDTRFLSIEPMLGPIQLGVSSHFFDYGIGGAPPIDLVIAGGESGPHARPSHPDWFRSLRDQCASAGVPFMFKQWGEWLPARKVGNDFEFCDQNTTPHSAWLSKPMQDFGDGHVAFKVGKKPAGRLLDGVEHNGRIVL